ncbi:acetate/propionate family kinase [Candidatus Falkowbacteria bacterium]|nr:acetate/propionate family kinase [Candidatus Falkowbacteria bacterium]
MPNILIINAGSTSLKYKLFDASEKEINSGNFSDVSNLEKNIRNILKEAGGLMDIKAVGHRVVHGGDKFFKPTVVNDKIFAELQELNHLAPLHNPHNLAGIRAMRNFLPATPQIVVFDTAFYFDLPEVSRTYALPRGISEKYKIRRYGFHGISHKFMAEEAARELGIKTNKINLITCHLGGGWSITAVKNGKPIDTSMGYTPMEGLIMMTRPGDLDAGVVIELLKKAPYYLGDEKCDDVYNLLNHESGVKGLSGESDYQEVLRKASLGMKDAKLAFDAAIYRLVKYIGAYWAALEGRVDAIVFSGAIGAGNPATRNEVTRKLKFLGNVLVLAIKANEELGIEREVRKILKM